MSQKQEEELNGRRKGDHLLHTLVASACAVLLAGFAFYEWAAIQLAHVGQSCPWGLPQAGHPLAVGAIIAVSASALAGAIRWRSTLRAGVVAASLTLGASALFEALLWLAVGASHYCFD